MATTNENSKAFITLDEIIKSALTDMSEDSPHLYARFKTWAVRGLNELNYDVLNNTIQKYLPVDATTHTAMLPKDYVNWTRVGVITQGNEIQDLAFDANLVYTPIVEEGCNPATSHCSCGCTDPLCAAISNATTTTETITINSIDYTKTTTICTNDAGTITGRICEPVVTNPTKVCTYTITFTRSSSELVNIPYTNFYFVKNNQNVAIGDVANSAALTSIMDANGFSVVSSGVNSIVYSITSTPNVWTTANFTNDDYEVVSVSFYQTSCSTPTPTVETVCYDTIVCETETLPCGCPVLNNEVVNTIQQWSTLFNEFIQRDIHGMDWQKALKQPLSWFGYFNVFPNLGVIQLDEHYPFDTVYLQYYTANEVDGGKFQVPVMAQEALAAYMKFKYTFNKSNISGYDKKLYQKAWLNEKWKLNQRNNPFRVAGYLDVMRQNPRP